LFLEAVLWIARTGSPWRDLPPTFGNWNTVFKRYRDWVQAGVSDGFLTPYRMIQTWSSLWSTRQSSKFTATRRKARPPGQLLKTILSDLGAHSRMTPIC